MTTKKKLKRARKEANRLGQERNELLEERLKLLADLRTIVFEDKDFVNANGVKMKWRMKFEAEDLFDNYMVPRPRNTPFAEGFIIESDITLVPRSPITDDIRKVLLEDDIDWELQGERLPHESIFELKNHK